MPTITQVIQRLLPYGTSEPSPEIPHLVDWSTPPSWPTDLFAVTATLVELAGCYAHSTLPGAEGSWHERARSLGKTWSELDHGEPASLRALRKRLTTLWKELLRAGHAPAACRMDAKLPKWCVAAMELMAIADEAAAGIGFDNSSGLAQTARGWHWEGPPGSATSSPEERRRRTATLCVLVPPEECCVQPKARTPQVGCNLRSLSLHLALLPPIGHVTTRHLISPAPLAHTQLNLLLVPYPYRINSDVFSETMCVASEKWGKFSLEQSWLPPDWPKRLAEFIDDPVRYFPSQRFLGEAVMA